MQEQSGNTELSLVTSQQVTHQQQQSQTSCISYHLISIAIILAAFCFMAFGLTELITIYQQTSTITDLECSFNECSATTSLASFQNNSKIYFYLQNPYISQNDISSQLEQQDNNLAVCTSKKTNQQAGKTTSMSGKQLVPNAQLEPCGKFIEYYPGEAFKLIAEGTGEEIKIQYDDLDVQGQEYKTLQTDSAWADINSERFKVWNQRQASLAIKKYWGSSSNFKSISYQIKIESPNPINTQVGQNLRVVISDNKGLSGNNLALCILNFMWSGLLFLMGGLSFWQQQKIKKSYEQKGENDGNFEIKDDPPLKIQYRF